ncbi:MAG: ABC transporter permease [Novosphingobium sp.]|nr:ABC transporter permease [Novosphingobium sp.]
MFGGNKAKAGGSALERQRSLASGFSRGGLGVGLYDIWRGLVTWPVWMRLAQQDIALRYKRSVIGPFWISLSLAAMIIGMSLLYSQIFKTDFKEYLVYLSIGLLCWNYLSVMINESCVVLTDDTYLRALPVSVVGLAGRSMMRNGIIFAHNLLTVLVMLVILQAPFKLTAFHALSGVAVYAVFGVLLGSILAPICLRFRDVAQVISSVLGILFFLTPIIWKPDQVGGRVAIVEYNPIFHLIEIVRAPLLGHDVAPQSWAFVGLFLVVSLFTAILVLSVTRRRVYMWM